MYYLFSFFYNNMLLDSTLVIQNTNHIYFFWLHLISYSTYYWIFFLCSCFHIGLLLVHLYDVCPVLVQIHERDIISVIPEIFTMILSQDSTPNVIQNFNASDSESTDLACDYESFINEHASWSP